MPRRTTNLSAGLLAMSVAIAAPAQDYLGPVGTPVDRNVGDTGPNSASQRRMQPGLGQFGVGSILLDRFDHQPHQADRFNPRAGDPRVNHRYLMQAPGVTAIMKQPDYIGISPQGDWVFNQQTFDGAEILTYSPDTVFVLSPELLAPTRQRPADPSADHHPSLVQPIPLIRADALRLDRQITGRPRTLVVDPHPAVRHNPNYVHPDIIERRKRLKAEREAEQRAAEAAADAEADANANTDAEPTPTPSTDN